MGKWKTTWKMLISRCSSTKETMLDAYLLSTESDIHRTASCKSKIYLSPVVSLEVAVYKFTIRSPLTLIRRRGHNIHWVLCACRAVRLPSTRWRWRAQRSRMCSGTSERRHCSVLVRKEHEWMATMTKRAFFVFFGDQTLHIWDEITFKLTVLRSNCRPVAHPYQFSKDTA